MSTPDASTSSSVYGGLEGPNSMYIKLISSDGFECIVRRDYAIAASPVIKNMFDGSEELPESQPSELYLADIPPRILIALCRYFSYKAKYANSSIDIPDFPIAAEDTLGVLVASAFLQC